MSHYCKKCGRLLSDLDFYTSNNIEKYPPNGKIDICKKCLTMHVDNWDPDTYKWILEAIDVPYVKKEWDKVLAKELETKKPEQLTGMSVLGKYLSKMKLKQYKGTRWADTERLAEEESRQKIMAMQAQGMTKEEIDAELRKDFGPPDPAIPRPATSSDTIDDESMVVIAKGYASTAAVAPPPVNYEDEQADEEEESIAAQLTEEDKTMLRLKWGKGYRPFELVRLEQLYNDMMKSYDIQGAGHRDTLIMVCKASLKANALIDAGD